MRAAVRLRDLYASYAHCIDTGAVDDWVDLWTPDGVLSGRATYAGHHELREFALSRAANWAEQDLREVWHVTSPPRLRRNSRHRVCGSCYVIRFGRSDDSRAVSSVLSVARYDDVLERRSGVWRFRKRTAAY